MSSIDASSPTPSERIDALDVAGCTSVLMELLSKAGQPIDQTAVRRTAEEVARAFPGPPEEQWWTWLMEAGLSRGLALHTIDVPPDDLPSLVKDGEQVVGYSPGRPMPWLVAAPKGRKVRVEEYGGGGRRSDRAAGKPTLNDFAKSPDGLVRCVVLEPAMQSGAQLNTEPLPPFQRLLRLLRPEWPDVWVLVVFGVFVGLLTLASPIAVEWLVNTVAFNRVLQPVLVLAVILFGFLAFSAALQALQTVVAEIIQRRLFVRVAGDLGRRLPRVDMESLDGKNGPELVNRFFDIVTVQKAAATLLLDGVTLVLGTLIGMGVLAFYHPWLLGFDVVLLVMMAVIVFGIGRGAIGTSIKESKKKYAVAAWLEELMRCPIAFRQDGGPELATERTDLLSANYLRERRSHFRILMRQVIFALALQALASTVLLGIGGWLVIKGQLTLGQLVAAELIVAIIVGAFAKMGKYLESFYDILASVDKLGVLSDLPLERRGGMLHLENRGPAQLRIEGLSYAYKQGGGIKNLNLKIAAGEKVLIEGGSGSGKTTLAEMLYGLRKPKSGLIDFDGVAPRDFRPDIYRRHVTLVRGIEIFDGTLAENVHLERPGVTSSDVRIALANFDLLEDVTHLPDGIETKLGPYGAPLSESQARRLMLARATAGNPRMLIVDGLLDSLSDTDLEQTIEVLADDTSAWTLVLLTGRSNLPGNFRRLSLENGAL